MRIIKVLILLVLNAPSIWAQSAQDLARQKLLEAVELMDSGNPVEAITLLSEAKKIDPENYIYDYEIGYAYFMQKDYPTSLTAFKQVVKFKNANDQCYQMLGNLYDYNGQPEKAIKAYQQGLKKFPGSGRLLLEQGNVYYNQKQYDQALAFYERGIDADPNYPSNYFQAANLYSYSDEKIWTMIYGEIFINLESNTARTQSVSKLLFDTYKSQITFPSDTAANVQFTSRRISLNLKDLKKASKQKNKELGTTLFPYALLVYEPVMGKAALGQQEINLQNLHEIRNKFIQEYFKGDYHKSYPNELFTYCQKLQDQGLLEPYNYWLLNQGEYESFEAWTNSNPELWERFVDWYSKYSLQLTDENKVNNTIY